MSRLSENLKIYLLGGSGFVGSSLHFPSSWKVFRGPRASVGEILAQLTQNQPNCVINLAAEGVYPESRTSAKLFEGNIELPFHIALHCLEKQIKFVHFGSCFEYGFGERAIELNKMGGERSFTSYSVSKLTACTMLQFIFRDQPQLLKIVRPFNLFGPGERMPRLFPSLLDAAKTQQGFTLTAPDSMRNFVFIEDFTTWFIEWLKNEAFSPQDGPCTYDVGFEPAVSVSTFAEQVLRTLRCKNFIGENFKLSYADNERLSCHLKNSNLTSPPPNFKGWLRGIEQAIAQEQNFAKS